MASSEGGGLVDINWVQNEFLNADTTEQMDGVMASEACAVMTKEDWHRLGFWAIEAHHSAACLHLIERKKVPILIVGAHQQTLMHAAVLAGNEDAVESLLDRCCYAEGLYLLTARCDRDDTPIDIAAVTNQFNMIVYLLECDYAVRLTDVINGTCLRPNLTPEMIVFIRRQLRRIQIRLGLISTSTTTLDELIAKFHSYGWWADRTFDWSMSEQLELYLAMCSAACEGRVDLMTWFIDEWHVSLRPPANAKWKSVSIADRAVMGKLTMYEDYVDLHNKEIDGGEDRKWDFDSLHTFTMWLCGRQWDGRASTILSKFEDLIKSKKYHSNRWVDSIRQQGSEQRLEVIKLLAARSGNAPADNAFYIPRLDIIIAAGQLDILKWFHQSGFIDLSATFNKDLENAAISVSDEEDVPIDDNTCGICLCPKRKPTELECGHTYCLGCVRDIYGNSRDNMKAFQCPYCRRVIPVPAELTTVAVSFAHYLQLKSPWMQYDSHNTIGEVMLGFAAGTGSVFIFDWLVNTHSIDPARVRYPAGRTVFHIAASCSNFVICKWLSVNCPNLAMLPCSMGRIPADELLASPPGANSVSIILDIFNGLNALAHDWVAKASVATHPDVVEFLQAHIANEGNAVFTSMLGQSASLADLIDAFNSSSLGDMFEPDAVLALLDDIIRHGRVDFLHWAFNSDFQMRWGCGIQKFDYIVDSHCRALAAKHNVNCAAILALLDNKRAADVIITEIHSCRNEYSDLIIGGGSVDDIAAVIARQLDLIKRCDRYQFSTRYGTIDFKAIVTAGQNTLELAARKGHMHIVQWILDKDIFDAPEIALVDIAVYEKQPDLLRFAIERAKRLNTLSTLRFDGAPLLKRVVFFYCMQLCPYGSEPDFDALDRLIAMIAMLLDEPQFNVNELSDDGVHVLFAISSLHYYFPDPCELKAQVASRLAALTAKLVDAGADMHCIDQTEPQRPLTFIEALVKKGEPVLLETIRYLAIQHRLDIQYLTFMPILRNASPDVMEQFAQIQRKQKQLYHPSS